MLLDLFYVLVLFLLGASVGSWLNVVILRSISGQRLMTERSHCPHCQKTLQWYELIPVLSFIGLMGRCRSCAGSISVQYPLVEFLAGIALLAVAFPVQPTALPGSLLTFIILCLLLVLLVIDLKTFLLPDFFIIVLGLSVIARRALLADLPAASLLWGVVVGSGFLLLLWLVTQGQGIGLGDVKLMVPLGMLFGVFGTVALLFVSFVSGGAYGSYLLLSGKATPKTALPFGPYLASVAMIFLLWPEVIDQLWQLFVV